MDLGERGRQYCPETSTDDANSWLSLQSQIFRSLSYTRSARRERWLLPAYLLGIVCRRGKFTEESDSDIFCFAELLTYRGSLLHPISSNQTKHQSSSNPELNLNLPSISYRSSTQPQPHTDHQLHLPTHQYHSATDPGFAKEDTLGYTYSAH